MAADSDRFENVEQYRVVSDQGIVGADHQLASEAGAQILAQGGNAADAGVTALLAIGVVNPFGSGLGGGGFCLYREADGDTTEVIDFRETAPTDAHRDLYAVDGEVDHSLARHGGLAVATPGEAAGIWSLHGRFGQLQWEDVVDPAVTLAAEGFPVGATLASHLQTLADTLEDWPELATIFEKEDGEFVEEGDLLRRDDRRHWETEHGRGNTSWSGAIPMVCRRSIGHRP